MSRTAFQVLKPSCVRLTELVKGWISNIHIERIDSDVRYKDPNNAYIIAKFEDKTKAGNSPLGFLSLIHI